MTTATKAQLQQELSQAYEALEANRRLIKLYRDQQCITWPAVRNTAALVWKEAGLAVRDCRSLGTLAAQWVSHVVDTYRQPVLRSR